MTTLAAQAWRLAFNDLPVEDGLAMREGTAWRHFPAIESDRFKDLLSVEVLDAFLRTDAARTPRVGMADSSRPRSAAVPPDEYLEEDSPRVDLPRLLARFDAGASLAVSQFHEIHEPLARFCRGLEKIFLHAVQANIYLTPPNAQGFRVHYDTHDVLVLQVSGQKVWRVWDEIPFPAPTRDTPWMNHVEPIGAPHIFTVQPGDVLYVPRGVMHDATTRDGDGPSLHITIGLLDLFWADMLRATIDQLEQKMPAMRQSFPTWRLMEEDCADRLATQLAPLLARMTQGDILDSMPLIALDRLAENRMSHPGRGLFQTPFRPDAFTSLNDRTHHHLLPQADGSALLRWYGGTEHLSAQEFDWLTRIGDGAVPATLGTDAIPLCKRLWALGLLEQAA